MDHRHRLQRDQQEQPVHGAQDGASRQVATPRLAKTKK